MRKFSFLLAIVALFAMSAAAFAADGDIAAADGVANTASTVGNIGKIAAITSKPTNFEATAYYLKAFNTVSLDLPMTFKFQHTTAATDMWAGVSTDLTGVKIVGPSAKKQYAQSTGQAATFLIGGWSAIPEKFTLNKIMSWGVDTAAKEPTTGTSGDITITTVSLDICLSADGKAQSGFTAYLGEAVDKKFVLDYNKTMLAGMSTKLDTITVGAISTGSSIKSDDITAANAAIKGLTVAFDETKGELTVKGTATAEGDVKVALYLADSDAEDALKVTDTKAAADSIAATAVSADSTTGDAYIIATFDLSAEKTEIDKLIDQIAAKPAVSADVVAALKAGAKAIVLTASGDQAIVNGKVAVAKPLSNDYDEINMTVAFLKLDGEGKVAAGTDPGSVRVVINDSTETNAVSFDVNGGTSPMDIATIQGVAGVTITKDDAANGDYTAYVIETPTTGGSEMRGAVPAPAKTYASQKFKVLATEPYSKSSSGACDMGFGLVAVAGLAALALRKRSK